MVEKKKLIFPPRYKQWKCVELINELGITIGYHN